MPLFFNNDRSIHTLINNHPYPFFPPKKQMQVMGTSRETCPANTALVTMMAASALDQGLPDVIFNHLSIYSAKSNSRTTSHPPIHGFHPLPRKR